MLKAAVPEAREGSELTTAELTIDGMHCSSCATRIERALRRVPGVASASVNLATTRAFATYDASVTDVSRLCDAVAGVGYRAAPLGTEIDAPGSEVGDHWELRMAIGWPLAIAALLVSLLAPQSAGPGWTILALAVTCELATGWPFLRDAARLARHGAASMDTLIALGTIAALSVELIEAIALGGRHVHIGSGSGAFATRLHFAMAPFIVAVLASGRAAESRARRRAADTLHSLLSLQPPTARLVETPGDERGRLVAPESVPVGALVRVRPNEAIPLDGTIVSGWSAIDESMLTGEPFPIERGPGSAVTGGTRNGGSALVVRVGALAAESVLSRLQHLVEEAQRDKAPIQRLADRVSAVFVPVVLGIAIVTFVAWWFAGANHDTAVLSALAVLLVACPCAMGLAAPIAIMVASGRAAALGIFVRNGDALERLARVDTVVFDKTGTLTERHATVKAVTTAPGVDRDELLDLAAAVEADSDHPIALAIVEASHSPRRASNVQVVPGEGVVGVVDGSTVRVGRSSSAPADPSVTEAAAHGRARGDTVVLVEGDQNVLGALCLSTPLRPEAHGAVRQLHELGLATAILSGDNEAAVSAVGNELGIDEVEASLTPGGKLAVLAGRRASGRRVLMVGDGVNDAPALAAADVGCAIGSGSEAALASSDVALLGNDLYGVPAAVSLARASYATIRQNFGWAIGYNLAALPLAAAGLIDPLVAAVAMAGSSLVVVTNSLRLARLGRTGPSQLRQRRLLRGPRAMALSVGLPAVIFAALVAVSQVVSPARGQSLLPELPTITTFALADGTAQVYLDPGTTGFNELHVFFYPTRARTTITGVAVTAFGPGGGSEPLRHLRVAYNHYINYAVLSTGTWTFHLVAKVDGRTASMTIRRTVG